MKIEGNAIERIPINNVDNKGLCWCTGGVKLLINVIQMQSKSYKVNRVHTIKTIISVETPSNDQLHYQLDQPQQEQQPVRAPLSKRSICINKIYDTKKINSTHRHETALVRLGLGLCKRRGSMRRTVRSLLLWRGWRGRWLAVAICS